MSEREAALERAAQAIFDAPNGIDGDQIGDMLYDDFRIVGDRDEAVRQTMAVCRLAAQAAIDAADDGWRPIASAPKDGTEILGWCERLGRHIVSWGCQPQHNPHHFWISSTCNTNHIDQPTHWQPLPPPPVPQS